MPTTTIRIGGREPEVFDPTVPSSAEVNVADRITEIIGRAERTEDLGGYELSDLAEAYARLTAEGRDTRPEGGHIHVAMEKMVHRREFGDAEDGMKAFDHLMSFGDNVGDGDGDPSGFFPPLDSDEGEADPEVDARLKASGLTSDIDFSDNSN